MVLTDELDGFQAEVIAAVWALGEVIQQLQQFGSFNNADKVQHKFAGVVVAVFQDVGKQLGGDTAVPPTATSWLVQPPSHPAAGHLSPGADPAAV